MYCSMLFFIDFVFPGFVVVMVVLLVVVVFFHGIVIFHEFGCSVSHHGPLINIISYVVGLILATSIFY